MGRKLSGLLHLPPLPGYSFGQDLCFLFSRLPSSFRDCYFIFGTPLIGTSSSFQHPERNFPGLNSLCPEAQHVIGLLIAGFASCLLINWRIQDVPCLFSSGRMKIYNQHIQVAAGKQQASAWEFQKFTHTHVHPVFCCLFAFTIKINFLSVLVFALCLHVKHRNSRYLIFDPRFDTRFAMFWSLATRL